MANTVTIDDIFSEIDVANLPDGAVKSMVNALKSAISSGGLDFSKLNKVHLGASPVESVIDWTFKNFRVFAAIHVSKDVGTDFYGLIHYDTNQRIGYKKITDLGDKYAAAAKEMVDFVKSVITI